MYSYDANYIFAKALPNRFGSTIRDAWLDSHKLAQSNGYAPKLHIIDNECSSHIQAAFTKHNVDFQIVPPYSHRRNAAERAIQTWKNHFIACLSTVDPTFPLTEWDRLIPQCNLTLNHLRSSRRQPKLSAYASIHGQFDFNRTPLAVILMYETPSQRRSFAAHGLTGYYVGPSTDHYRCYKVFLSATDSTRDAVTLEWFPHTIPYPTVTHDTYLRQTAEDLLALLKPQNKENLSDLTFGSPIFNAYVKIAQILKRATTRPTPTSEPTPPTSLSLREELFPTPARESTLAPSPAPTPTPAPTPRRDPTPAPPRASPPMLDPTPAPPQHHLVRKPRVPKAPPPRLPAPHHDPRTARYPLRQRLATNRYGRATQFLAQAMYEAKYAHHIAALGSSVPAEKGKLASLRNLLKGEDATIWTRSAANEFGRLLPHGVGKSRPLAERITGTGTMFPIQRSNIPRDRKVTYANFVCGIRPQKSETHRVRLTASGDKLDYPGDPSSPAVSTLDAKIHINSTISDAHKGARYMTLDIKNFYLGTPLAYYQYIRVHISLIPLEIIQEYNLVAEQNGYVYFEIRKGIYGLKEAGVIAFKQLVAKLKPHGYENLCLSPLAFGGTLAFQLRLHYV